MDALDGGWSPRKTKLMTTTGLKSFELDGKEIEVVNSFVFLGACVKDDGTCEGETRWKDSHGTAGSSHEELRYPHYSESTAG